MYASNLKISFAYVYFRFCFAYTWKKDSDIVVDVNNDFLIKIISRNELNIYLNIEYNYIFKYIFHSYFIESIMLKRNKRL